MYRIISWLNILYTLPIHPSSFPKFLATTSPFNVLIVFLFPECNIVQSICYVALSDCLLSFTNMHFRFLYVFSWFEHISYCTEIALSRIQLSATPWTVAYQAPPSMGLSRQEYWSGLPLPSPGYLPNPGVEPRSSTL